MLGLRLIEDGIKEEVSSSSKRSVREDGYLVRLSVLNRLTLARRRSHFTKTHINLIILSLSMNNCKRPETSNVSSLALTISKFGVHVQRLPF